MRIVLLFIANFIAISSLFSQNTLSGTAMESHDFDEVLKITLKNYSVFEMEVEKSNFDFSDDQKLNLNTGLNSFDMTLYPNNLMVSYKDQNLPHLLSGHSSKGENVNLTINDDFIYGYIKIGSARLFIEPVWYFDKSAPRNLFVSYYDHDVIHTDEHKCGVETTDIKTEEMNFSRMITDECVIVDYALANTHDMVVEFGSVGDVEDFNLAVLNTVQANYRSEFDSNVEYNVVDIFVPSSSSADPFPGTSDSEILLDFLDSWGDGGGSSGGSNGGFGVNYHIAGLWLDRDIIFDGQAGVVGIAQTPGWHHVFENFTGNALQLQVMTSHEIGHNWNYGHDGSGSGFIMAPSVNATDTWSTNSVNAISSRIASFSFFDDCGDSGPPVANFFQSSVITCVGSGVEFEDQSQYGATRVWEFENGSPGSSTSEKPTVTFNTMGQHYVKLTSSNSAGTDEYIYYVDVQGTPSIPCSPSGSGGAGGITNVTFENVSNSSGDASSSGRYEDFACTQIINLEESTAYNLFVTIAGTSSTRFSIFLDYNGDGDFDDFGENEGNNYNLSTGGNWVLPLTTNSNPVEDEVLRLRLISDTGLISSSCENTSYGQVEDYGVVFSSGATVVLGCTDATATNYDPFATVDDGSCDFDLVWYRDVDNDGFGNLLSPTFAATPPNGYVANFDDCNDADATVYPSAPELCDGQINNCNSSTLSLSEQDNDGDGYVECSYSVTTWAGSSSVVGGLDCDDTSSLKFPSNPEICDGLDNDCDGLTDEVCEPCQSANIIVNNVTQNTYRAQFDIISTAVVNSTQTVYFFAGSDIEFGNNFEVKANTNFVAEVQDCIASAANGSPIINSGGSVYCSEELKTKIKLLGLIDQLRNSLVSSDDQEISIMDISQKIIFNGKLDELESKTNLELSQWFTSSTIYLVQVLDGENQAIGKFIRLK